MFDFIKTIFANKNMKLSENLKERFSQIYVANIFGGIESRSGEGSNMIQTSEIRGEIPNLVRQFNIQSFLDAPCGDFHWMKEVNLGVEKYIGVDIVEHLIEKNNQDFNSTIRNFQCLDLVEDKLPQVDLIFCRDCLVHLSFDDICKVINNFKRSGSKYLLTTTFTNRRSNDDLGKKVWRTLNLQISPISFPAPLKLINEKCTEANNQFSDKCLGLWRLEDLHC
jgi:hypothetical protein